MNMNASIIGRQIKVIEDRLKEPNLSPETIRHLNERMREWQSELDKLNVPVK